MKKYLFSLAIMAIVATMPTTVSAQGNKPIWMEATITLDRTDKIMVMDKVFVFFGHNVADTTVVGYFLTLDSPFYEEIKVKKGKTATMEGPYLSDVWQANFMKDYRALNKADEQAIEDEITDLKQVPDKEKKKEKKKRLALIDDAKARLAKMKSNHQKDDAALVKLLQDLARGRIGAYLKMNSQID